MYLIKFNSCKYEVKGPKAPSDWLKDSATPSLVGFLVVFFISCCYVCCAKDKAGHILITLRWSNDLAVPFLSFAIYACVMMSLLQQ